MQRIDPIETSVWVPLAQQESFDLFTDQLDTWWPVETHSLSAAQNALPQSVAFIQLEGGDIVETLADGTTATWAEVTKWAPPYSFELAWHVGLPRDEATRVEVTFTPEMNGTRVSLIHDGFNPGDDLRAKNYAEGWPKVLDRLIAAAD